MKDFYTSLTKAVVNLEEGIAERTRNIKAINEELKNEIDEHMKTEEKLSQARHEAEQANRTKSSFFAGISHELRTPLNAILGYSQILMRDASLSKESMRQVETIKTSGEHLLGLINEVLEMSRIEAGKVRLDLSPCAISSVLEEIRMLFAGQASRKGLAFSVREESPLPDCVMTDRSKLKQILINLVGNAMKFTDSGFIDVRVAGSAQHPDIVEFSVRDTGKGIPPVRAKAFLPMPSRGSSYPSNRPSKGEARAERDWVCQSAGTIANCWAEKFRRRAALEREAYFPSRSRRRNVWTPRYPTSPSPREWSP